MKPILEQEHIQATDSTDNVTEAITGVERALMIAIGGYTEEDDEGEHGEGGVLERIAGALESIAGTLDELVGEELKDL